MITPQGSSISGSKTPEGWKPGSLLQRGRRMASTPAAKYAGGYPTTVAPTQQRASLEATLSSQGPFPALTAILGVDLNGTPLVLDLADPTPGAILISGQAGSGRRLLRAILASTILINRPQQAAVRIIANEARHYDDFFRADHVRQILSADDPAVNEACVSLLPEMGLHTHGSRYAPATLLLVDDLAALAENLDKQAFASLCWLARHGSRLRTWLIATLPSGQEVEVEELLLEAFGTRLIENDPAEVFNAQGEAVGQFRLALDDQTIQLWMCEAE